MLKIAWRNIMRNKRRSCLSLGLILVGVAVLFLLRGYFLASYEGLEMMAIHQYSHVQIAKRDFWDQKNIDRRILSLEEINTIERILNEKDAIKDYTKTLQVSGILGTEKSSTIVSGIGIEPSAEQNIEIKTGTKLFGGDKTRIIVGEGIRKKLDIKTDEWVSIMATTTSGAFNAGSLQLSGSFSLGNADADNHYIMMPLGFAQTILNTEGVDKFKVMLTETKLTPTIIEELKKEFKDEELELKIKSWNDLATYYHQVKGLYDTAFFFLSILVFIIIFISILEIMSMSFFERMREIGTTRAIGTFRYQVFIQLIEEALILGIIGGSLGVIAGWALGDIINNLHITYTPPSSQEVALYIKLALSNGVVPLLTVVVATLLSALYPALKASKLKVVDLLRHV